MDRKIRVGDLAMAIGATPKALRHWLTRYDGIRPSAAQGDSWREFSAKDVAAFAIARPVIDFGYPAEVAYRIAVHALASLWTPKGEILESRLIPSDGAAILRGLRAQRLYIARGAQQNHFRYEIARAGAKSVLADAPALITIDLHRIVGAAFEALRPKPAAAPAPKTAPRERYVVERVQAA